MVKIDPAFEQTAHLTQHNAARTAFVAPLQIHTGVNTVDHVLLPPDSHVAVISPDEGLAASLYAKLRPHWQVTSWVPDMKTLLRAQNIHTRNNLHFDKQPASGKRSAQKIDAIVAVGWAHRLYSRENYNLRALVSGMQELLAQVPRHGQILIQDIALPEDPERLVLLDIEDRAAAMALQEFARIARPQAPVQLQGFFLESLPSARPQTQRFRLSLKWATEFFQRQRLGVSMDAPFELTTLSVEQWATLVEQCGARAVYRAPQALSDQQAKDMSRVMRFYDVNENAMELPAATFSLVVEKIEEDEAVTLYERRPSNTPPKDLVLRAATDPRTEKTTKWIDLTQSFDDVLVWRRDAQGHLRVWLQADVPRPIINTVARGTANLDGRRWAGYLAEPLSVQATATKLDKEAVAATLQKVTGVAIEGIKDIDVGVNYYPAPEYLAQRVRGLFVQVTHELPPSAAHTATDENPGRVIAVLADDVLRALSAGLIPDSKLEILIGALMHELGEKPQQDGDALEDPKHKKLVNKMVRPPPARVHKVLETSAELESFVRDQGGMRCVRSVFVADQSGPMGRQALHVTEDDFLMPGNLSANSAVCIPLIRNPMGKFLLGGQPRKLPIPNRLGDDEPMMSLPAFRLPETVTTIEEVRRFLANQFSIDIDDVTSFGPSFFLQPHLSPERVYPFVVHAPEAAFKWDSLVKPNARLARYYDRPVEKSRAYIEMKARRDLGQYYMGLTPDITADITARVQTDSAPIYDEPQNDNFAALKPQLS